MQGQCLGCSCWLQVRAEAALCWWTGWGWSCCPWGGGLWRAGRPPGQPCALTGHTTCMAVSWGGDRCVWSPCSGSAQGGTSEQELLSSSPFPVLPSLERGVHSAGAAGDGQGAGGPGEAAQALPALQGTSATCPQGISGGSALAGSVLGWAVTVPCCAGRDWDMLAVLEASLLGPAGSVGAGWCCGLCPETSGGEQMSPLCRDSPALVAAQGRGQRCLSLG